MQNTYMQPVITLKIKKILYSCVQENRKRIKKVLIRQIKNGGINMLDLESFLQIITMFVDKPHRRKFK